MVADGDADALQLPRLLALSGCPLPEELLSDQRSTFLMYAKEVESEAIGPARFLLGVAGYQSKRVEVALPRIESTIERMVVELEPLGQHEFGELSVEFVDPPWAHGSKASLGCVVGRLGMKTLEAGIPVLEFPIRSTSDQRVKLGGIPYGTYRAVFNTTGRQYSVPNRDISDLLEFTVGPIRASVQIRFGPVGALRLNIHGTDGEPFELPVSAQVRRTGDSPDGSMYPLNFLEWPYRVDAFRCGTYDILLDARVNTSIGTARVVQFHSVKVEPGKETVLDAPVVIDPPADGN